MQKRGIEYSQQGHCVCIECRSQKMDGNTTKTLFTKAEWYYGGPITELNRHVDRKHCGESQSASIL